MSRIAELREKIRKKGQETVDRLNSPQGRFECTLYTFVSRTFNASRMNAEFAELMYTRFVAEGADNVEIWLREATRGMFHSVFAPPRWILEPDWCFYEGLPLEFVHQFSEEEHTEIYVFRGKREITIRPSLDGYREFYKMIAQCPEGISRLQGEISY